MKSRTSLLNLKRLLTGALLLLSAAASLAHETLPFEGQSAPDFTIQQADGTLFQLNDYRGKKPVYLVFWNSWCGYCLKKVPQLKRAQSELSEQIQLIAINTSRGDSLAEMKAFQQKFQINYPLAFDSGEKVTDLYQVSGVPTSFIIDINGVIQLRDGVPDNLQPHLARWRQLQRPAEIAEECEKGELLCG